MRPLLVNGVTGHGGTPDALEPIAVVGLATRVPQATSTESLWEILLQARSTWSSIPKERFNAAAFYHPDPEHGGTFHVQGGHFLAEDPAYFDGSFFNITKNELLTLDPQQRLVLENVFHALENSGISMADALGSNTSVFVSGFNHDYLSILNSDPETNIKYKPTGVTNSILSNRVSWFFDFKGPSMTIDTACSSSLVALHLAVQSLRARETNMALVSGVSILENPVETIGMSHHGLLGAHGRSFSFDARAEGYARGEGVGTIVLKPLSIAVRDGDTIRAVIRETGVNQDGRTPGITVPSAEAQERLIREVYWRAGLDLEETRFVEAHGTGTPTGDPIEAGALARAFKCRRDTPLYIGTIKSTLGHLEGGSGVASLIKSILILESGIIPPNFDLQKVNPKIPAEDWNLAFPTKNIPWPSSGLRRISVNSFGIGGTNAHCVLDDAYHYLNQRRIAATHNTTMTVPKLSMLRGRYLTPQSDNETSHSRSSSADESDHSASSGAFVDTPTSDAFCSSPVLGAWDSYTSLMNVPKLFMLSAFDEDGVQRNASAYAHYLDRKRSARNSLDRVLDDLSFTLSNRRSLFPWKSFVMASTPKELAWNLSESRFTKPVRSTLRPEVSFVFTGQGAQYQAMGSALLTYPVFQESLEEASEYIRRLGSPWSLIEELVSERKSPRVNLPEIAHPLCTALQVAIVDLLASWGVFPKCVTGHSSGEIAAAYCAGKLSREGAWKAAYYRGYVSSKQLSANGAMMAVGLGSSQLEPYLDAVRQQTPGELIIACYNSPKNNTVSGDEIVVDTLKELLDSDGVFARKLNVKNAYHSAHMVAISEEYLHLMGNIANGKHLAAPHMVHMISTVTGKEVMDEHLPGQYWVDNMVSPVKFTDGLTAMNTQSSDASDHITHIVEIGPHSTLQSAIKETLGLHKDRSATKYLAVLKRNDASLNVLLNTVGFLAVNGCAVDLHKVNIASRPRARLCKMLVDLPPYVFKHTEKILYESRLSKNVRQRKFPRHDLFGAPVADWNVNIPRWRHFVRLNENPWLRDHVVTGNCVYPGVGYLIMTIEAARQLAGDKQINGFQLRQVSIRRALIVPDTKGGIEVSLSMTTADNSSESRLWRRFQISSYNESSDEWTEHCSGYIHVELTSSPDPVDNGRDKIEESRAWKADLKHAQEICTRPMNFHNTYDNLQKSGLNFGPLFRNLGNVRSSGSRLGSITGTVTVPDIAESMPKQYMHDHLIHPATMDSMIHMMIASILDQTGKSSLEIIRLPTYIRDMWVSADLNSTPQHKFTGHASVTVSATEKVEGVIRIMDETSNESRIRMDGIELTPLESGLVEDIERQLCTTLEWKPDLNFLDSRTACELNMAKTDEHDHNRYWIKRLQLATMLYVTDALDQLAGLDVMTLDLHLRRFWDWMKHTQDTLFSDKIIHLPYAEFRQVAQDNTLKYAVFDEIEGHSSEGAITARMGRNIAGIMRQEVDPLHLMFGEDAVMEGVYKEGLRLYDLPQHLISHLSLLRHQYSELNILEIGGGTGSFTAEVLNVLSPESDATRGIVAHYTFTDISSGFFEKAKKRFQSWSDIMTFQSLNIERSPIDQGFETGKYDLIFAGNVIHATANLHNALGNLHSLLRPGGQLIMQEGIRQDFLWYPLVFGQLPGWWLGNEPIRKWCPYIPATEWNKILSESGFSGADIEYPSSTQEDLSWQSIIVSTATGAKVKSFENIFILSSGSPAMAGTIDVLRQMFPQIKGAPNVTVVNPSQLDQLAAQGAIIISLIDLEKNFVSEMDEPEYKSLKKMLMEYQNILWVTPDPRDEPFANMSMGLLRTVRWERDADGSNIVTLAIADSKGVSSNVVAINIRKIVERQFLEQNDDDRHGEYHLKDSTIYIGRLCEWKKADNFLTMQSSNLALEMKKLCDLEKPIKLVSESNDLHWIVDDSHQTPLSDTEIEVEVHAVGLNSYSNAAGLSNEASGIVKKAGGAVEGLALGDRVNFLSAEATCFRTLARVDQTLAIRLPENVTFEVAAGLSSNYTAALYSLREVARLSEDDTVLIHSGASALGQSAIQYAKMIGAKIYTTVSKPEDRSFITSNYGIPNDHVYSSGDLSFARGIMRSTKGAGIDVIFNTLTGEALQESLSCIAPFGRFIEASSKKSRNNTTIELTSLERNVTMSSIDMSLLIKQRPKVVRRLLRDTLKLFSEGKIGQVHRTAVMDFTQIKDTVQALRDNQSLDKMVFVPDPSNAILVAPDIMPPFQFDSTASYLLAGGLGGLGRSLARWMASRGAQNLIFLSRTGTVTESVEEMIADLKILGCNTHIFACDVADADRLRAVVDECSLTLPPIKGCFQGSMVLRDGAFASMSFDDWKATICPKVQGSWNLHQALPQDLDFFVMLSSVAGIFGNRGQANYAAGNTFQDALAAFRTSKGLKASSINLGSVSNVGWVAENRNSMPTNTAVLFELLREDEVHAAVEFLIDTRYEKTAGRDALSQSQLVLGLPTTQMCQQNGIPPPTYLNYSLFTQLRTTATAKAIGSGEQKAISTAALLAAASNKEDAVAVVSNSLIERLSSLLAIPTTELDPQRFGFGGIDSLVAMEFRSWIVKELKAEVSLLDIMGAQNIFGLSEKIAQTSRLLVGES
ncbi:uncharacterized protein N7443_003067 [Penicillium atrosanguineum]|uniref:uncharacterized protein n=1 Tax=Penicillium atrosanguineum TaxID=1132637 RepID=UPI002398A740|nr:uncharacterized protein N7443_003067 [Penicillium atrosanguineum]KAJ5310606.1 hypothetical protein N7443_003067 [Penicillium atrosanguineum]